MAGIRYEIVTQMIHSTDKTFEIILETLVQILNIFKENSWLAKNVSWSRRDHDLQFEKRWFGVMALSLQLSLNTDMSF